MYTYKDLKIAVLQKLDEARSTLDGTINQSNLINDYTTMIPSLLNEALQYCATAGRFIVKSATVTQDGTDTGRYKRHSLTTVATDFYSLLDREIYFDDGNSYALADNYTIEGDNQFVTDPTIVGTWTIYYNSYPQTIAADTITDATEISVAPEVYALLADHIAGEILMATGGDYAITRKSEFEQRRQELKETPIKPTKATVKADDYRRFL